MSPGKANAHFSLSRGMSVAVRPAAAPSWKRVFEEFCPQLVHCAPDAGLNALLAVHRAFAGGVVTSGFANDLPVRNSAIARRSAAVRLLAMVIIVPVSM